MAEINQFESNSIASANAKETNIEQPVVKDIKQLDVSVKPSTSQVVSDAFRQALTYVGKEVLGPALKRMAMDMITNGASMVLFKEPAAPSRDRERRDGNTTRVSYDRRYDDRRESRDRREPRDPYSYDVFVLRRADDVLDISFDYRQDAEIVLDQMRDVLDTYKELSVAEVADMLKNVRSENAQNNHYGWDDPRDIPIHAERRNGRYYLGLPYPKALRQ